MKLTKTEAELLQNVLEIAIAGQQLTDEEAEIAKTVSNLLETTLASCRLSESGGCLPLNPDKRMDV